MATITTTDQVLLRTRANPGALLDLWFLHGFGESGLSFREVFGSPLAQRCNLFAPDFPGFGVSPFVEGAATIDGSVRVLGRLLAVHSPQRPVVLLGHSLGGIVATRAAVVWPQQVRAVVSIEGNLTRADTFGTGQTIGVTDAAAFHRTYVAAMAAQANGDEALLRYVASLRFADPRALLSWGQSCYEATGVQTSGEAYAALACPKLYLWGDGNTPAQTRQFIHDFQLVNHLFPGAGHWPMIDQPEACYRVIAEFVVNLQ
ncbi:MAG: alpha/beta hydrolase [Deltaproteobacteria bacterium]|nr:alpha/beta hydrolase [Deltaproteobacteria bacterium]